MNRGEVLGGSEGFIESNLYDSCKLSVGLKKAALTTPRMWIHGNIFKNCSYYAGTIHTSVQGAGRSLRTGYFWIGTSSGTTMSILSSLY